MLCRPLIYLSISDTYTALDLVSCLSLTTASCFLLYLHSYFRRVLLLNARRLPLDVSSTICLLSVCVEMTAFPSEKPLPPSPLLPRNRTLSSSHLDPSSVSLSASGVPVGQITRRSTRDAWMDVLDSGPDLRSLFSVSSQSRYSGTVTPALSPHTPLKSGMTVRGMLLRILTNAGSSLDGRAEARTDITHAAYTSCMMVYNGVAPVSQGRRGPLKRAAPGLFWTPCHRLADDKKHMQQCEEDTEAITPAFGNICGRD